MTNAELIEEIKRAINLSLSRDHAKVGTKVPFMTINFSQPDNFAADNGVYFEKNEVSLKLYCFEIDPQLEQPIKDFLSSLGLGWTREETYLDDEKVWEIEFGFETL